MSYIIAILCLGFSLPFSLFWTELFLLVTGQSLILTDSYFSLGLFLVTFFVSTVSVVYCIQLTIEHTKLIKGLQDFDIFLGPDDMTQKIIFHVGIREFLLKRENPIVEGETHYQDWIQYVNNVN